MVPPGEVFMSSWLTSLTSRRIRPLRKSSAKKHSLPLLLEALEDRSVPATFINYTGGTYTNNFDSLPSTGSQPIAANPNVTPVDMNVAFGVASLDGWTVANASGTFGTLAAFTADDGVSATGGRIFSYGAAGSTERALGTVASNSGLALPVYGLTLRNATAATITQFTLSFTEEGWRNATQAFTAVAFSHLIGAAGANTILSGTPSVSTNTALNLSTDVTTTTNAPGLPQTTAHTATVTGITWNVGEDLILRWFDPNDANTGGTGDDGNALDDFTFSTSSVVGPPAAVNDTATANTGVAKIIPVLANDALSTASAFTVTSQGSRGATVTIDNKGTPAISDDVLTYTSAAGVTGTDTFTYSISDGTNPASSATVTVTVSALAAPVAVADTATANTAVAKVINVLANDTQNGATSFTLVGGSAFTAGVSSVTTANGTVTLNNNNTPTNLADDTLTFTSAAAFTGSNTFSYNLANAGGSATATVTVNVSQVAATNFVSYTGGTYTQNFNNMPPNVAAAPNVVTTAGPVDLAALASYTAAGVNGWQFGNGDAATVGANASLRVNAGLSGTLGTYWNAGILDGTDRALVARADVLGYAAPVYGVVIRNDTTTTINTFNLGFAAAVDSDGKPAAVGGSSPRIPPK